MNRTKEHLPDEIPFRIRTIHPSRRQRRWCWGGERTYRELQQCCLGRLPIAASFCPDYGLDLVIDLIDWLIDFLIHSLIYWLIYWLIDWFIDWFIDLLIYWFIYWLIDFLNEAPSWWQGVRLNRGQNDKQTNNQINKQTNKQQ